MYAAPQNMTVEPVGCSPRMGKYNDEARQRAAMPQHIADAGAAIMSISTESELMLKSVLAGVSTDNGSWCEGRREGGGGGDNDSHMRPGRLECSLG